MTVYFLLALAYILACAFCPKVFIPLGIVIAVIYVLVTFGG